MSKKKRKASHAKGVKTPPVTDKLAAKKAAVLGTEKKRISVAPLIIILFAGLLSAGVIAYALKGGHSSNAIVTEAPQAKPPAASETAPQVASSKKAPEVVSYPETLFMDGLAKYFEHQHGDITIRYFILKSVDGVIRAAFDACDVCWPAGKGYVQDGDDMICRNCGRRFSSTSINEVKGGCNPAPLEREVKDGAVFIKLEKILEGQGYFDFSQHT